MASKEIEFGEKREIRAITPFKVIQGHRGRYKSKACMRHSISDMGGVLRSGLGELRAHVRRAWQREHDGGRLEAPQRGPWADLLVGIRGEAPPEAEIF